MRGVKQLLSQGAAWAGACSASGPYNAIHSFNYRFNLNIRSSHLGIRLKMSSVSFPAPLICRRVYFSILKASIPFFCFSHPWPPAAFVSLLRMRWQDLQVKSKPTHLLCSLYAVNAAVKRSPSSYQAWTDGKQRPSAIRQCRENRKTNAAARPLRAKFTAAERNFT